MTLNKRGYMKNIKIYHIYTDKFFNQNLIDIVNKEFDLDSLTINLNLKKSKNPLLCPDSVEVRVEKVIMTTKS